MSMDEQDIAPIVQRLSRWSRLSLKIQKTWLSFWQIPFIFLFYTSLSVLIFDTSTPGFWVYAFYLVFLVTLIWKTRDGFKHYRYKDDISVFRALEKTNEAENRPLDTLNDDVFASTNKQTHTLWDRYKDRQKILLKKFKPVLPDFSFTHKDPKAFATLSLLIFFMSLVSVNGDWSTKATQSLLPFLHIHVTDQDTKVQMIVTPPTYTGGLRQSYLAAHDEMILIPQGSILDFKVYEGFRAPILKMGGKSYRFEHLDTKDYGLKRPVLNGEELLIKQFFSTRAKWLYSYIPDKAPNLDWDGTVSEANLGKILFDLNVFDDYGIEKVVFKASLNESVADGPKYTTDIHIEKSAITAKGEKTSLSETLDLTRHLWSGLPIDMEITVYDHLGQSASTVPSTIVLPTRNFSNPIAKGLIELRTDLAWNGPEALQAVTDALRFFIKNGADQVEDPVTYLLMSSLYHRSNNLQNDTSALEVINMLWDVALRFEEGGLADARDLLAKSIDELKDGLNDPNLNEEELALKYQEFQDRLSEYLERLNKVLKDRLQNNDLSKLSPEELQKLSKPRDLSEFLEELLEDLADGDKGSAADKLSRLEDFLNNLNPSLKAPLPLQLEFNAKSVDELSLLIQAQEDLIDQTKSNIQKHENGDTVDTSQNAKEQDGLRLVLGEIIRNAVDILDQIPEGLSEAELAMRRAAGDLNDNDPDSALPHQEYALEKLKEAQESLQEQLSSQIAQLYLLGDGPQREQSQDPLGRTLDQNGENGFGDSDVDIPEESEKKRVEEILKELRDRSGEFERDPEELDYIKRLLKRF